MSVTASWSSRFNTIRYIQAPFRYSYITCVVCSPSDQDSMTLRKNEEAILGEVIIKKYDPQKNRISPEIFGGKLNF